LTIPAKVGCTKAEPGLTASPQMMAPRGGGELGVNVAQNSIVAKGPEGLLKTSNGPW